MDMYTYNPKSNTCTRYTRSKTIIPSIKLVKSKLQVSAVSYQPKTKNKNVYMTLIQCI